MKQRLPYRAIQLDKILLCKAIQQEDVEQLKAVLSKGTESDIRSWKTSPLLHAACKNGNLELVKVLVSYGINNFTLLDKFCRTPLHWACAAGNIDLVHVLVRDYKADLNIGDCFINTPLMIAAKCKQYKTVKSLVCDYGCDPNVKGLNGRTPLHFACTDGDIDLVHVLLRDLKADLNIRDNINNTPLMTAAKCRQYKVVKSLVCDYGCDPNVKGSNGRTLLHFACADGDIELMHVLVRDLKADLNIKDDFNNTPLMIAAESEQYNVWKSLICDYGCDPNVVGSNGRTLLHLACTNGDIDLVHVLVQDYKTDLNIKDNFNNTPLMTAVESEQYNVWKPLVCDYGCDPYVIGSKGRTLLHLACTNGDIDLVHVLVQDYKADLNIRDDYNSTPLLTAAKSKQYEIVKSLVCDYGCDPNDKGFKNRTLLHFACADGNTDLVNLLIRDFKADLNIRDDFNDTPLMTAALSKQYEVWKLLVCEYDCDVNVKGFDGRTLLHYACSDGNISLVHALIKDCKANLYIEDNFNKTPHMIAASSKQYGVWKSLVCDYGCDPNVKISNGRTVLHLARADGDIDLVHALLRDCKADLNIKDNFNNTPLMIAANSKQYGVWKSLVCDYGCDPNVKISNGRTVLHLACADGDIDFVHVLVRECKADLNVRDDFNNTPFMVAAESKQCEVVKSLVCDYSCDPNMKGFKGRTQLHFACADGETDLVHVFIKNCKADLNIRDDLSNTPLMTAVHNNKCELVKVLISEYKCDVNVRDDAGRSLLHIAGDVEVMRLLIEHFKLSPSLTDNDGNTPLHLLSSRGLDECVRVLLFDFHAPVYIRNKDGEIPSEKSTFYRIGSLFTEYLSTHGEVIEADYKSMQLLAAKRYSGSNFVCRLFVVGHPGAGKSSLIEILKREGFFESFSRVSEKSVPPHTAGIVPSVFISKSYGRVQFYDFAGDPEYYSSHAAILERLFQSNIGSNICILVLNLVEEAAEIEKKYRYWMCFINYSFKGLKELPSIIVIGSHSDKLSSKDTLKKEDFIQNTVGKECAYLSLDCCSPRSGSIKSLRQSIWEFSKKSKPYCLTYEESIMLGLLEKDFSNVTACTAQTITKSVGEVNLSLPRSVPLLYPILQQLQAIGVLLIVGGNEEGSHVVLNVAQLTNEVHEKLFAKDGVLNDGSLASFFNIGLLPESLLQEILPKYITKECLIQLQYCQEVSHIEIESDLSVSPKIGGTVLPTTLSNFLFFPALCSLDKKDISWQKLPEGSFTIGWLARCSDPHDFFPPRFLHVLLLRIALRFTLIVPITEGDANRDHQHLKRRCKMWKSGVHWLTGKGVECEVDVKESKEIVVSIQSKENSKSTLTIFNAIINCVMETKAEFCHSVKLKFSLLDAFNSDNLYSLEEIERVLQGNDTTIVSVSGNHWMDRSKLVHINSTFWENLFPVNEHSVLDYININTIGDRFSQVGVNLDLSLNIIRVIESNHPGDMEGCIKEMVSRWLGSSLAHSSSESEDNPHPPCWWRLVEALKEIGMNKLASDITRDKGEHITLQRKLLSNCHLTPDEDFLESFSGVVGSKWPFLASLLSLTSSTIEEVRREGEGLTQRERALLMLHKWVSKGEATYDQLYQKLKPVSLFNYC